MFQQIDRLLSPVRQLYEVLRDLARLAVPMIVAVAITIACVQTTRLYGFQIWSISMRGWIETAEQFERDRDAERAAHRQTKIDYRNAQIEAARLESQRLDRVRTEQQEITDAVEADYSASLADARTRAERLREDLRTRSTARSAADPISVPSLSAAGAGTSAAAENTRLPSGTEQLERDLIATEQAIQLDALIDWVKRQAAVQVSGPEVRRSD
ncbi:hypothetical protein ACIGGE_12080 [Qipengyuania sp. NPDC077410]|uniref:hypothetical protein n=1 Tax=Qipengyuania sp. NPDC077410 TaxID=3364496 RepID=UPI0037C88800